MLSIFKRAFPRTIPVLAGYIFLGIAYGISMAENGLSVGWSWFISVIVFGGSLQFAMIPILTQPFAPLTVAVVSLLIQARHIFYGLSMLDQYEGTGKWKPYLIATLSDETYSLVVQGAPEDVDKAKWFAWISGMDKGYWIIGSVLGGLIGSILPLSLMTGIDFAMTALFTVIVTEQNMEAYQAWKKKRINTFQLLFPTALGFAATLISLLLVGTGSFLLLAMGCMLCCFLIRWFTMSYDERRADT